MNDIVKKILAISVPIKNCNLHCEYCYIAALNRCEEGAAQFKFSPEHVGKCLSKERVGGTCIINLTGGGETLLPKEMPQYIYHMLKAGHYLEVVTNGTITKRFEEIAAFPEELLRRLEFKFSFHYKELKRLGMIEKYFNNIKKMKAAGCSFTVELMPYDEIIKEIDDIIDLCEKNLGAKCQLTVGRNDLTNSKEILTNLSYEMYKDIWKVFESEMFDFKLDIFGRKINEFCYAGLWSLYIDLGTGETKQCYGQLHNQNIFKNPNEKIKYYPVGKYCRQPYCYNGHAYLTIGLVPELKTPHYSDMRNKVCNDGTEWFSKECKCAFTQKLHDNNDEWSPLKKKMHTCIFPLKRLKDLIYDREDVLAYLTTGKR